MAKNFVLRFACVLSCAVLPAAAADPATRPPARFVEVFATQQTLQSLRAGGFVLYLRHGNTDNTRADRVPSVDLNDCATQRPLTEEGRQVAARVGEAIRKARIPVAEIRISPMCRVRDTVAIAFPGQAAISDKNLMYTANLTDVQKAPIIANTRHLLSAPVPPGTNRVLVAHAPNLMDLIGYFPREATLVVFRPMGAAGFEYVASVAPAQWPELLR
ncbi:histidine phosphatase family protein [Zoogloea sp.]|uniref:histidine phosphatase family protein n=1 Tax=Zoogloea sp. TaxID=49181 RepID=UPI002606A714|nr:histidine phosphatase family protein [Zoogloea sp.]